MTKREFLDTVFALAPNEANAIMDAFDEYVESNVVSTGRSGKERRMTKYIIEIPDDVQYVLLNGKADNKYYTAVRPIAELEELNSDYINEHFGELQDEAYKQGYADAERIWRAPSSDNEFYQKGLEDAWKAARRIVVDTDHGGLALGTLSEIFDTQSYSYIMRENTAQEAIDKIKAYEDKHSDRIEVGDEVATGTGKNTPLFLLAMAGLFADLIRKASGRGGSLKR